MSNVKLFHLELSNFVNIRQACKPAARTKNLSIMAKTKTAYVCENCGQESVKWLGRCPSCGAWNTFKEVKIAPETAPTARGMASRAANPAQGRPAPVRLSSVKTTADIRIDCHDTELNRVLGGGIVPGSLILIGGEPGIGKSTLMLQTIMRMPEKRVLYVSGEESEKQIKLRAERIENATADCFVVCETSLEHIFANISECAPDIVIIDSIQTISTETNESAPGSLSQVRECAAALLKFAKESGVPVFLIGHITKEGVIAGPKVLEHIVDVVLQFEGDRHYLYRILRSIKNRFGNTSELGIYEMDSTGLRSVENPSELLLSNESEGLSGVAVASTIEGVRPLLIETQALVSTAAYGVPQRSATGFDIRRMNMLLAVLEKRVGFKLAQKDVFLNIAGGLRVADPAIDLSVVAAVLSSNVDTPIDRTVCMTGEVGLSGEIRPVARIAQRILEAEKLGFKRIIIPRNNIKGREKIKAGIEIIPVGKVEDALRQLFG